MAVLLVALVTPVGAGRAGAEESDPVGVWPLVPEPTVVHGFDPPTDPYGPGHRGVDLAGSVGQVVRAALGGEVTFAGMLAGRGVVVVSHGATRTTYEPVRATVAVGDTVASGAPIGRLELTLSHCFPAACLHWGWIEGEVYLDPLRLVGGGPIRLLPLWRELTGQATAGSAPGATGAGPDPGAGDGVEMGPGGAGGDMAGWVLSALGLTPVGAPAGRSDAGARW